MFVAFEKALLLDQVSTEQFYCVSLSSENERAVRTNVQRVLGKGDYVWLFQEIAIYYSAL